MLYLRRLDILQIQHAVCLFNAPAPDPKGPDMPTKRSIKRNHRKPLTSAAVLNFRAARAAILDRLADAELQHGHHLAAEHLAHRAAQLRERAR